ncbi:hypothetical protein [Rhodopila globiformis]|uniref:Flagellar FliJ protein n=1 Tax=Rhodopila globiformis TaxID=1071 RepID=A0A2S6MZI5_RHOGL|nr:hypothetical protein [Rhodopila globiformis]PPQ27760.1 hypothetical protein CCS01_26595 [Rhodopila globiformis]
MSGLDLLIRLSRRTVEERQVTLARASQAHAEAVAAIQAHEEGIAAESLAAANDIDALAAFANWSASAARRGNALQQRRSDLARSEHAAQGALHEAFIDLKRLELALDAALETAAAATQKRADAAADELQIIRRNAKAA